MADSDSGEVVGGEEAGLARAMRSARPIPTQAKFRRIYIVVACSGGFWQRGFRPDGDTPNLVDGGALVLGVVLTLAWVFARVGDPPESEHHGRMRTLAARAASRAQDVAGFIEYPVLQVARLVSPVSCSGEVGADKLWGALGGHMCSIGERVVRLGDVIADWRANGAKMPQVVRLAPELASKVVRGWSCLHCVVVTGKTARSRLLNRAEPSRKVLSKVLRSAPKGSP